MPTTVYETLEIKLSNGDVITVAPLKINRLKKFLAIVKPLQEEAGKNISDDDAMEIFVKAVGELSDARVAVTVTSSVT